MFAHSADASPVNDFYSYATDDKTVLISTCNYPSSGCHDFSATLKAQFENLNSFKVVINEKETPAYKFVDTTTQKTNYETVFLTGCSFKHAADIVKYLEDQLNFTKINTICFISPPHHSFHRIKHYSTTLDDLKKSCGSRYTVRLFMSGIDCLHSHSIGLPKPFIELESKFEAPSNCYGLIYIRKNASLVTDGKKFLENYFSYISYANQDWGKKAKVIALAIPDDIKKRLTEIADEYDVEMLYLDKLPQPDFIKLINAIAAHDGMIAIDGVQTLLQAFYLKAKVLIYKTGVQNELFYYQFVCLLPEKLQSIAEEVLGLYNEYDRINPHKINPVFEKFYDLVRKGVSKFEIDKAKYSKQRTLDLTPSKLSIFSAWPKPSVISESYAITQQESKTNSL